MADVVVNLDVSLATKLEKTKQTGHKLVRLDHGQIRTIIREVATLTEKNIHQILAANKLDLQRMDPTDPKYDRLKLTEDRIASIIVDLERVADMDSPLGKTLEERTLPSGLHLQRTSVPLGVIGIIFESRPNVMFDVFALCFKAGNACVLKGGSDASSSNLAIAKIIHEVLQRYDLVDALLLLDSDRSALQGVLNATDHIDVIIPRGSQGLIDHVRQHAKVPVIETGAGIVHTYIDATADLEKAAAIVTNAKTRRVSVCNALDTMIIHQDLLQHLPFLTKALDKAGVEIFADQQAYGVLLDCYGHERLFPARESHFGTEFLSMRMSIKTVQDLDEALTHINQFSSKHSEAIVAEDQRTIDRFLHEVDAAVVYANTSTAYTDGGQFGLGAEIGISTQKLHARGPMALAALTSYKWLVQGDGQVRNKS